MTLRLISHIYAASQRKECHVTPRLISHIYIYSQSNKRVSRDPEAHISYAANQRKECHVTRSLRPHNYAAKQSEIFPPSSIAEGQLQRLGR